MLYKTSDTHKYNYKIKLSKLYKERNINLEFNMFEFK